MIKIKNTNQLLFKAIKELIKGWRIKQYFRNGRKPWSIGYSEYKEYFLNSLLKDDNVLNLFRIENRLPPNFGYRLDERAVEYPWLFCRLNQEPSNLIDAGSALNFEFLLNNKWMTGKSIVIYNLSPEKMVPKDNVSYIYGDLRHTILKDDHFDDCVTISTLEHIGLNNKLLYSNKTRYIENNTDSYFSAIKEMERVLKPGGRLFITVPYGIYQNLGWLQQFDSEMISRLVQSFGGHLISISYFKYRRDGWQISHADDCANCRYFDIHSQKKYEDDFVAAARAVACIELVKQQ